MTRRTPLSKNEGWYEQYSIEFFAERGEWLFSLVREIDVYNETKLRTKKFDELVGNNRRIVLGEKSRITCSYTEQTKGFIDHLIEKYTNGKEETTLFFLV